MLIWMLETLRSGTKFASKQQLFSHSLSWRSSNSKASSTGFSNQRKKFASDKVSTDSGCIFEEACSNQRNEFNRQVDSKVSRKPALTRIKVIGQMNCFFFCHKKVPSFLLALESGFHQGWTKIRPQDLDSEVANFESTPAAERRIMPAIKITVLMHNWFRFVRSWSRWKKDLQTTGLNRIIRLWFMIYAAQHKSTISFANANVAFVWNGTVAKVETENHSIIIISSLSNRFSGWASFWPLSQKMLFF